MAKNVTQSQLSKLIGIGGLVIAIVLSGIALGAWYGYSFATSQVHSQLAQEKISFPAAGSKGLDAREFPGLQQYGGQPVDTGSKAKAYADQYIWVHMMKASEGKSYAEISNASMADPKNTKLAGLKATLFQGDMLRSSLLTAYAFSVFGTLAGYLTIITLIAAVLVLAFSLVCFRKIQN